LDVVERYDQVGDERAWEEGFFWDAMVVWSKVVAGESNGNYDDDDHDMQDFGVSVPSGNGKGFRGDVYTVREHGASGGTGVVED